MASLVSGPTGPSARTHLELKPACAATGTATHHNQRVGAPHALGNISKWSTVQVDLVATAGQARRLRITGQVLECMECILSFCPSLPILFFVSLGGGGNFIISFTITCILSLTQFLLILTLKSQFVSYKDVVNQVKFDNVHRFSSSFLLKKVILEASLLQLLIRISCTFNRRGLHIFFWM